MVNYCCAFNCKEKQKAGGKYSFHGFPKNEKILAEWCKAIRRKNFLPTKHSKLCSKHFKKYCYKRNAFGFRSLKEDAIPSVFNFPQKSVIESSANQETANSDVSVPPADTSIIQDSTGPQHKVTLNTPVSKKRKIYDFDFDNLKEETIPSVFSFSPLIGLSTRKPTKPSCVRNEKSVIESSVSSDIIPGSSSLNQETADSDVLRADTSIIQDSTGPQHNTTLNTSVSKKRKIYAGDIDNLKEVAITSVFNYLPLIDLSKMKLIKPPCVKNEKSVIESSVSSDIFPGSNSASRETANSDVPVHHADASIAQNSNGPLHNTTLNIPKKRKTYAGDFDISDMYSPEKAMKFHKIATTKITKQQKEINALMRKNRNLKACVTNITSLLNLLWKKTFN